jgi:hypothetical protein
MSMEQSFREQNRASTERMRALAAQLTDAQLQQPVGAHWTVAITLTHIAFWDRRVLDVLDRSEQEDKVVISSIDIAVNDLSLPLWAAIPPREAAQLAIDIAATLDARLETYPPALLAAVSARNVRWVNRALHRDEHLDEIDAALRPSQG